MRIFISYRRNDCPEAAGRLYETLRRHYGALDVFMDTHALPPGADFVVRIEQSIALSDVVLAVIGRHWLTVRNPNGQHRLEDPSDFVRLEIATALARDDVRVIPVLVEDARMPTADELPAVLKKLSHRHAIVLADESWRSDTAALIDAIGGAKASRSGAFLWLIPGFLAHGGLAMLYAGLRAKEKKWLKFGILYTLPIVAIYTWVLLDLWEYAAPSHLMMLSWFSAYVASLIHTLLIHPAYLGRVGTPSSLRATPWVLPSLVGFGGPALIYAGLRARRRRWLGFGLFYSLPTAIGSIWGPISSPDAFVSLLVAWLWFAAGFASLIHAMLVRSDYDVEIKAMRAKVG